MERERGNAWFHFRTPNTLLFFTFTPYVFPPKALILLFIMETHLNTTLFYPNNRSTHIQAGVLELELEMEMERKGGNGWMDGWGYFTPIFPPMR